MAVPSMTAETAEMLRVRDLPLPVVAVKTNWRPAGPSLDFTPRDDTGGAREACRSTVAAQAHGGYVAEYISRTVERPNPGFEDDPDHTAAMEERKPFAGRLIAVHRLRPSARPLREIMGDAAYEKLQDMWAKPGKRHRWAVAFPIIESYAFVDPPDAERVFGEASFRRILGRQSSVLRPLDDPERAALADLVLVPRPTVNAWIGIEDEAAMAERSEVSARARRDIRRDLAEAGALEGLTEERKMRIVLRAAWLADRFVRERAKAGRLTCDACDFDPLTRVAGTGVSPRSIMDVHRSNPLAEGKRYTTVKDFRLLCPICHRLEHAKTRIAKAAVQRGAGA